MLPQVIWTYFQFTQESLFLILLSLLLLGEALLKQKQKLLENGYAKCEEYIRQLAEGRLKTQPGCNPEESLEAVILKGIFNIISLGIFSHF